MVGEGWGGGGGKGNGTVGEGGSGLGGKRGGGAGQSHCALFHSTAVFSLPADQQPVAGVWNVGVLSEWGPARTQSQMVLRGGIPPIVFSSPPPTSQAPPTPSPLPSHVLAATGSRRVERGGVQRVGGGAHAVQDAPGMDALYGGSLTHQCLRASSPPLLFTLAIPQPLPKLLISIYPEPPSSSSASSASPLPSWLTGHARSANASPSVQLRRMALLGPSNRGAPAGPSFSVQPRSETEEQAGSSNSGDVRGNGGQEGRGGAEGGAGVDVWWSEGRMDIGSWQAVADPGSWHLLLSHPASSCQWPLIPLEPHLLSWSYESGLDAAYLPPASPAPPSLWASWFPVPVAASPSPARPSWAFLSLAPPFGARGGVLSIHLRLRPLRQGPGADGDGEGQGGEAESGGSGNNSSAGGVAVGSSGAAPTAFVYLLVRAGGLPSLTRFDASAVAPATDMAARGGQLSLELIHPAEVTTFVAVGLDAAAPRTSEGGKEESDEEGEGEGGRRGVGVGVGGAGGAAWVSQRLLGQSLPRHGRRRLPIRCLVCVITLTPSTPPSHLLPASSLFHFLVHSPCMRYHPPLPGIASFNTAVVCASVVQLSSTHSPLPHSYCFCDRSHGGVDCSIETVSQLGACCQVEHNAQVTAPSLWCLTDIATMCSPHITAMCSPHITAMCSPHITAMCSPHITAMCSPHITAMCSPHITAMCSPHITAMCSPHITAMCSPHITAMCSPHITAMCSPHITAAMCSPHITAMCSPHITAMCSPHITASRCIEQQRWALVGSNVVAVLPAMVSLYLGAYPEWVMFSLNGLCSALYHLCDTDGWCAARYPTLQFADFYSSFLAVLLAFLHVAQVPIWPRFLFFVLASFSTAVMAVDRATSGWSIVVLLALGAAALITGWFIRLAALRRSSSASSSAAPHAPHTPLEAASCAVQSAEEQGGSRHGHVEEEGASLLPPPCSSDGEWPCGVTRESKAGQHASVAVVLRVLLALLATFHVPSLLLGALAALLAASSFLVEVPATYWIWHRWGGERGVGGGVGEWDVDGGA
ncbi:unnamed protein product [Closterium sp. NIES-65]|nr:unnamed protein product [Closterium sp. NIES-65]